MPLIDIDLTTANLLPEGNYVGTVEKLEYQVKKGDKWNQEGTAVVPYEEFASYPANMKRLHYTITVPGKGNIFADFYLMDRALGFIQNFLKSCGVSFNKSGFDPEAAIGCQLGVKVGLREDPEYGTSNTFSYYKV